MSSPTTWTLDIRTYLNNKLWCMETQKNCRFYNLSNGVWNRSESPLFSVNLCEREFLASERYHLGFSLKLDKRNVCSWANLGTFKIHTAVKKLVLSVDSLRYIQTKYLKMHWLSSCIRLVKFFDTLSLCCKNENILNVFTFSTSLKYSSHWS